MSAYIIGLALACFAAVAPDLQEATAAKKLTEKTAREIGQRLEGLVNGDRAEFYSQFIKAARETSPDFSHLGVVLTYSDEVSAFAVGPGMAFLTDAAEKIRRLESVSTAVWPKGVSIVVAPSQINAPSFDKVVVTRDGKQISPLVNELKPTELTTRMGAKRVIFAGQVTYPADAFLPGAEVVVTLIPESGANVRKVFDEAELRKIQ